MSDERTILQEAVDAVAKYGSISAAAEALAIPRKTLSGRYNKAIDRGYVSGAPKLSSEQAVGLDSTIKTVMRDKRELQKKYDELLKVLDSQRNQLSAAQIFADKVDIDYFEKIKIVKGREVSESAAFILCSDLHYEENVDPRTVDGLNEYNIEIAKHRFFKIFQNGLKLVEMSRSSTDIKKLVLWLGGDLIAGYIHDELMESNSMSPIEACIEVYKLCVSAIDFLVENGGLEEIVVVTSVGNHARTTEKIRISTCVDNNYEWLIYNFLASHYENSDIVKFKLSRGYFNYLDVYGYIIRFHHGNYVRYAGGVGGVSIPLNKAIAQWNQARPADLDIFGHWHQRISGKNFVGNGSVIGYGPYAISIKAAYEPPQQSFFLVHPKHGKSVEAPIFLE